MFVSEANAERFIEAFVTDDSFSFTMDSGFVYGHAYGPNPHIDPRWEKCAVAYNNFGPKFGHLEIANQFELISSIDDIENAIILLLNN